MSRKCKKSRAAIKGFRGKNLLPFGSVRRTNLIYSEGCTPISRNDIPVSSYTGLGNRPGQVGYWSRMDEGGYG